jgi:1-deoxy-D-xylulose-5-phosphate reductoisomerase
LPERARRRVAVLGSTGSIGRQALDVLEGLRDEFAVVALAAGQNAALLAEQVDRHQPAVSYLAADDRGAADDPRGQSAALVEIATRDDVDIVLVATGGMVSLGPVVAALEAGKVVATANKETLVAGGHLVMPLARRLAEGARGGEGSPADLASRGADVAARALTWLRPIDSEHSAIWQCLAGEADGREDHRRLGDADEQGPRGPRGDLAVRCPR